ncbi:stonustoxin subunit beta [Oreochromis niloticus]|uniref:stonustoxin subunit beta n=1 Tax=Oreochromis niloticus TaxID=8128 RepID=UPI000DF4C904|nr:stonustoxin subunit beta-like [Oreochromis niloticus]
MSMSLRGLIWLWRVLEGTAVLHLLPRLHASLSHGEWASAADLRLLGPHASTYCLTHQHSHLVVAKQLRLPSHPDGGYIIQQVCCFCQEEAKLPLLPLLSQAAISGDSCQLAIDTNTVNRNLKLSDNNRKVTHNIMEVQSYPDHPDRFDVWPQLLCSNEITGRCYWEVEWKGNISISVSYRRIGRKGNNDDCWFGLNDHSWSLHCTDGGPQFVCHNCRSTTIPPSSSYSSSVSNRVAVYVDCPAGTLSFYKVSSGTLIRLHTFNTTFTEPVYPGFLLSFHGASVCLC